MRESFVLIAALSSVAIVTAAPNVGGFVASVPGQWSLTQRGTTGVEAMQLSVMTERKVLILDKVESNPLMVNGHNAWGAEFDIIDDTVRPLNPKTNTFCASGSFLSNGTFVSTGGSDIFFAPNGSSAGFDDGNGLQGLRLFTPCDDGNCDIEEFHHITSNRWYPATARLPDGSVFLLGGWMNASFEANPTLINPTFEFWPPKGDGKQIPIQFLMDSLGANGFPVATVLPDNTLFLIANNRTAILDISTNIVRRLPDLPNGVRIGYPFSGMAVLLPLTEANNFTPEMLVCGGSQISDEAPILSITTQDPTSNTCHRLVLTNRGIAAGWVTETMPVLGRTMASSILLPDGRVLIVNGAQTGVAAFAGVGDVVGTDDGNADHPAFKPLLYDPNAAPGSRFSQAGLPTSNIARMYHSVATLLPDGTVMIAGSNPVSADVNLTVKFPTEYRVERLSPAYLSRVRPTFTGTPNRLDFGGKATLSVNIPPGTRSVSAILMDFGFSTHGIQMDQRLLQLSASLSRDKKTLTLQAPSNPALFPPGPGFLLLVTDSGVPSAAKRLIIGTGANPPLRH